jgi:hypothetical protein
MRKATPEDLVGILEGIEDELGQVGQPTAVSKGAGCIRLVDCHGPEDWPYTVEAEYAHLFEDAGWEIEAIGHSHLVLIEAAYL